MDIDALTDDDRKELAKDLAAELDTGLYGDRAVLSRRQLLSLAGGSAGVAGLIAVGVDPATAQSAAGQVGTERRAAATDYDVRKLSVPPHTCGLDLFTRLSTRRYGQPTTRDLRA